MKTRRLVPCLLLLAAAARAGVLHVPADFPTIQAAVDASVSGDTILIAAGSYPEQVVMSGADDLTLRGQGQVELTGSAGQTGLHLLGCVDTLVEHLSFRGMSQALNVDECTGIEIRKCSAKDIAESAFQALESTDVLFDRCLVDGAADIGFVVALVFGGELRHCTVRNVEAGLSVAASVVIEVDHLRAEHVAADGILASSPCAGLDVHHSRLIDVGTGLDVDSDDGRFSHDLVIGAVTAGVQFLGGAERNLIDHERVVACAGDAFVLGGSQQEARSCRAVKPAGSGFQLADAGRHLLQDSRASSPGFYGILVNGGCTDCTLLGNRVTHAPENGIDTEADRTILIGNVATGSGIDGFRVGSELNTLTENKAHGSGEFDLRDLAGSSTYVDNHFATVGT